MKLVAGIAAVLTVALYGQTLPDRFADTLVADISVPTALAFTPDGRMLVTSQSGTLRVIDKTSTVLPPALTIPANRICTNSERGLLGIAVDPQFASTGYIYLYYTHRDDGVTCGSRTLPMPMNRVSRFVLTANNTVDPATETVLISNLPSWNGNHNGGDIQFGWDGFLYVSVGDSGCDPYGSGCAGANDAARDVHTLLGKILRITRTGAIPPGNPWTGDGTARCNIQNAPAGVRCQETWAWGLRNPFRMAFMPGEQLIMDVGQDGWEEVNRGAPGADYGWNQREGACVNGSLTDCPAPPPGQTDPVFSYAHGRTVPGTQTSGCGSIAGGAIIPPGLWPAEFDNQFLFADYVCGSIFRLRPGGSVWQAQDFAQLPAGTVHLTFGTDALYYTTYANGGQVRRIRYNDPRPNNPPTAVIGPLPTVYARESFPLIASRSTDPDGDAIVAYRWDFGLGGAEQTYSFPDIRYLYFEPGRYTITLQVRDARGAESAPVQRQVEVLPQQGSTPTIVFPNANTRFRANDNVELRANVEGTWSVNLSEDGKSRLYASGNGAALPLRTPGPASLELADKTALAVSFGGWSSTLGILFRPQLVPVTLQSDPPGMTLNVNGSTFVTPATFQSWPEYPFYVSAPDQQGYTATVRTQKIVTPAEATTIRIAFAESREPSRLVILGAAGYQTQNLAPGAMGAVRATEGLAFTSSSQSYQAADGPWPESLGGLQVSFGNRYLPLYVADAGMITFEVPSNLETNRRDLLRVWRDGEIVDQIYTTLDATAPGIFADSQTGAYMEGKQAFVKVLTTGLRNAETIEVLVNGTPAEMVKLERHAFPGVDELTVGIPANVYHPGGVVTLIAAANGKASNVAKVRLPE